MKKFKNSRLSTDSRKLQTLALNNNLNTVNSPPLIRCGLNTFTLQGDLGGLKKLRCLYFLGGGGEGLAYNWNNKSAFKQG